MLLVFLDSLITNIMAVITDLALFSTHYKEKQLKYLIQMLKDF